MQKAVFAICLAVLFSSLTAWAHPRDENQALELIRRASAVSDIQAKGAPAFRLHALLRVRSADGKVAQGQLLRIWTPAGMEHKEQSLGDYHSVEVSSSDRVWVASNLRYVPFPMFLAKRALNLPGVLRAARGGSFRQPFRSAATGEECVRTERDSQPVQYCFNPATGELRRLVDSPWNVTFEYSRYESFAGKKFPSLLRVLRSSGRVFIEIRVDRLERVRHLDFRAFLPVKGSKEHPLTARCARVEPPKLEKMVRPQYPKSVEKAGITGVVRLYAEIGADGIPRGMWPINASLPELREASIAAVRQWRYRPQTCRATGKKMPRIAPITILFVSR